MTTSAPLYVETTSDISGSGDTTTPVIAVDPTSPSVETTASAVTVTVPTEFEGSGGSGDNATNPCLNGGSYDYMGCTCPSGFTGLLCEIGIESELLVKKLTLIQYKL